MTHPNRRFTDRLEVRLFIGTAVICTTLVIATLTYAIWNTNVRVTESVDTIEDGVICIMGNIAGRENIVRPTDEDVRTACALFLRDTDSIPIED